jgi:hypothetical protein
MAYRNPVGHSVKSMIALSTISCAQGPVLPPLTTGSLHTAAATVDYEEEMPDPLVTQR